MRIIVALSLMAIPVMAFPLSAEAQTTYYARQKMQRPKVVAASTPSAPVKACGTSMKTEIWGVDGDGYDTIARSATGVDDALSICEAKFKTSGAGVCGYWTNGTVYYWKSTRTENRRNSALMGTICQ